MHKCILGIETSCDETAAAVVVDACEIRSNVVASQIKKHAPFGGVVPELAAREHLKAIKPVVETALNEAGRSVHEIDAIAVTAGPGLLPALLVGLNFAKGLASASNLPLIGIDHFHAHIYGAFMANDPEKLQQPESYPIIALVVSGGHTALVLIHENGKAEQIGNTLDDAAGEAFDKVAKLLKLGYPGGPVIERLAKQGNPAKFAFPRGLTPSGGKPLAAEDRFNFSFSGVKTAVLYHSEKYAGEKHGEIEKQMMLDTVASFQEAVIDVLCRKTADAANFYHAKYLVLCGGVACNGALRTRMQETLPAKCEMIVAPPALCTDNAAMIAGLAWHELKQGTRHRSDLDAYSRLPTVSRLAFASTTE